MKYTTTIQNTDYTLISRHQNGKRPEWSPHPDPMDTIAKHIFQAIIRKNNQKQYKEGA